MQSELKFAVTPSPSFPLLHPPETSLLQSHKQISTLRCTKWVHTLLTWILEAFKRCAIQCSVLHFLLKEVHILERNHWIWKRIHEVHERKEQVRMPHRNQEIFQRYLDNYCTAIQRIGRQNNYCYEWWVSKKLNHWAGSSMVCLLLLPPGIVYLSTILV